MNRHLADHPDQMNDRGASLVEYVLLLSLIVLVCLASLSAFGEGIGDSIDDSANRVVTATG
ncbi:MAG: Flp family type IVb pilin [Actinomycetota bacterium]